MGRPKRDPADVRSMVREALSAGGSAAVGISIMEMRTGVSQTNLRAALRTMIEAGEVDRIETRARNGTTCAYRLTARRDAALGT